jgi:hypothetical protein
MIKIKLGKQFFEHSESKLSIELEREGFLYKVERLAPHVLEALSREPLSKYLATGISQLDLTRQHKILGKPYLYRDINPFWTHIESQWFTCAYDVHDNAVSERKFIHDTCAHECHKALAKAVAKGEASEIDFMFEKIREIYPPCPQMYALWNSLFMWANDHCLIEREGMPRWCLESAFYTLDWWATHPQDARTSFSLGFSHKEGSLQTVSHAPPACLEIWRAEWEDEEAYIERMRSNARRLITNNPNIFENNLLAEAYRKAFINEAEKYCRRIKRRFKSEGWQQARVKPKLSKHLEWAVRTQINGESFYSLQMSENVNRTNIIREVEKLLDRIGLIRRLDL